MDLKNNWHEVIPVAFTVSDADGKICYMNNKSRATFEKSGGGELIGKELAGCHTEASNERIEEIIRSGKPNCYTIDKNGVKKMIYQVPMFDGGKYIGIAELSLELPDEIPHFIRK